jgi:hypothetical protein
LYRSAYPLARRKSNLNLCHKQRLSTFPLHWKRLPMFRVRPHLAVMTWSPSSNSPQWDSVGPKRWTPWKRKGMMFRRPSTPCSANERTQSRPLIFINRPPNTLPWTIYLTRNIRFMLILSTLRLRQRLLVELILFIYVFGRVERDHVKRSIFSHGVC